MCPIRIVVIDPGIQIGLQQLEAYESAASDEPKEFKKLIEYCKKQKLSSLFEAILEELSLTGEDIEPMKHQLCKLYTALNAEREENLQQYKLKLKELEEKMERLEERFINEEIKADLYETFSAKFRKEKEELEAFVGMTSFSHSNLEKYLNCSLDFLVELPSLWASSGYKEKTSAAKGRLSRRHLLFQEKGGNSNHENQFRFCARGPAEGRLGGKRNRNF